jgi:hypothetical protein
MEILCENYCSAHAYFHICYHFVIVYIDVSVDRTVARSRELRRGADKSLAFPIFSTTKRIFLGWVKEVRTAKS